MGIFPHAHNDRNVLYPNPTTPVVSLPTVFASSSERAWETAIPGARPGARPGKFFIGWVGAGGGVTSKIAHTVSTPCDCSWCKESQFYGLPFGHVVASMY